ncbi:unnamed protein product [Camellia sinensis]
MVFVDEEVRIAVFPVVEEGGADGAVEAAREEGEVGTGRGGWWRSGEEFGGDVAGVEMDFREGNIFLWVEAFGGVGIAQDSD